MILGCHLFGGCYTLLVAAVRCLLGWMVDLFSSSSVPCWAPHLGPIVEGRCRGLRNSRGPESAVCFPFGGALVIPCHAWLSFVSHIASPGRSLFLFRLPLLGSL